MKFLNVSFPSVLLELIGIASNCYLAADGQPLSFWLYILVLNARTDGQQVEILRRHYQPPL